MIKIEGSIVKKRRVFRSAWRVFLSFVIFLIAVNTVQGTEESNLAPNPGFEEESGGGITGWTGSGITVLADDAHSGNRVAKLQTDSQKPTHFQQFFTSMCSGRIKFWYKAIKGCMEVEPLEETNLNFYVIPLNSEGKEYPPFSRTGYEVPASHIGDGKWHNVGIVFNYLDKPAVKSVAIGPRINEPRTQTAPIGPGEIMYDDFDLTPIGTVLKTELKSVETSGSEGKQATLVCELKNEGDKTIRNIKAILLLPQGAGLKTINPVQNIEQIEPLAANQLKWTLDGERASKEIVLVVEIQSENLKKIKEQFVCKPILELEKLRVPRYILQQGEQQTVSVTLLNTGAAIATDLTVEAKLSEGLKCVNCKPVQIIKSLAPGEAREITWTIAGEKPGVESTFVVNVAANNARPVSANRKVFISRRIDVPREVSSGALVYKVEKDIILENKYMRLIFPLNEAGYGLAEIQVRQNNDWRTMGVMPYLGRMRFLDSKKQTAEQIFNAQKVSTDESSGNGILKLQAEIKDAEGVNWLCESTFVIGTTSRWVECTTKISADKPREITFLEGPVLLAGEGATGATKDIALFPGLDIIGPKEVSSAVWNPKTADRDMRITPDPVKVTIPLMAVSYKDAVVGIMWNALDKWDDVNNMVSPRFLCPNFEELYDHNYMSLFVPTVPKWIKENTSQTINPYILTPGKNLCFRFQIVARSGASALDLQSDWLDCYGVPEVPEKPWTYEEFLRLSIKAENELRFDPARFAWLHMSSLKPGEEQYNPQLCTVMWLESIRTKNREYRDSLRKLVLDASKFHSQKLELNTPFHTGFLEKALEGSRNTAQRFIGEQQSGGGWPLKKSKGLPGWIGENGTIVSGTCAVQAKMLMRYALITGAPDAYDAARRGIAAIELDPIPRGGQTWEVPVQVADIIVAGYVSAAYLDAYRISGDLRDLERAVYWAKTGTNFVYMWHNPAYPVMLGCSIGVYGSSWFARPVQWCGREMLEPLLELEEFDRSLPWHRIAECLVVGHMQQTLGPDLRMYPDTAKTPEDKLYWSYPYEGWTNGKWNFEKHEMMFIDNFWLNSPRPLPCWKLMISGTRAAIYRYGLCEAVSQLTGYNPKPSTVVLRSDKSSVHISAAGKLSDARMESYNLIFRVSYYPGETSHALVAGLGSPERVLRDGKELPHVEDIDSAKEGWKRFGNMLLLKISDAGNAVITVEKAGLERPLDVKQGMGGL